MEKTDQQGLVDLFGLDHSKYQDENAEAGDLEETVSDQPGGVEQVEQGPEDEADDDGEDLTPEAESVGDGDASGEEDESEEDGDGKQAAEEEQEEQEDAPSNDDSEPEPEAKPTELGSLMQELVNDGTLEFDEEKEYDLSKAGLEELITETKDKAVAAALEQYKSEHGDDAKQLLDVLENGGSVNDFVQMNQQVDFAKVPLQNNKGEELVQNQAYMVGDWMKIQGYDKDEINEKITELHDAGLLAKEAARSQKKLSGWQEKQNEDILASRKAEKEQETKMQEEAASAFQEQVLNTREIAGFKITKQQAQKLYDYVTKPVGTGGETQFAMDDNSENRMLYAYFAMSGFDKSKLSKEIATKQALKLKKGLGNYTDSAAAPKGGDKQVKRENGETPKINWAFA
jgi:hypothetical protein